METTSAAATLLLSWAYLIGGSHFATSKCYLKSLLQSSVLHRACPGGSSARNLSCLELQQHQLEPLAWLLGLFHALCCSSGSVVNRVMTDTAPFVIFPMVSKVVLCLFTHCTAARRVACPSRPTLHDEVACLWLCVI